MPQLFVGTSGWAYPSWKPDFYPAKLAQKKFLSHYATQLNTVEVNFTFRQLVKETTIQNWIQETPAHFRLGIKAHQVITHIKRLKGTEDFVPRFLATIAPLASAGKLGPVLFQLPPNLKVDPALLKDFLALLPRSLPAAFEFRHDSWFAESTWEALKAHGAALCVAETEERTTPDVVTGPFAYYRYRKPSYTGEERKAMVARIGEHLSAGRDVFAYFKHEETPEGALYAAELLRTAGQALEASSPPMEAEKPEGHAPKRSRISLGALTEIENALRNYDKEVLEAGRAGDGLTETTIKTYGKAEKFVDWLKYDFAPGGPPNGPGYTRPGIETPNIKRLAAKKSRVSLPALLEAEAALDEYIREVLHARRGERATNQLSDPAEYFVRWLKYEFAPGSRKSGRG